MINGFRASHISDFLYDNFCDFCNGQSLYPDQCPVECLVRTAIRAATRREVDLNQDHSFTEADAHHAMTGE